MQIICSGYAEICINMHKYARNMQEKCIKHANNMHRICKYILKYAQNMQIICKKYA